MLHLYVDLRATGEVKDLALRMTPSSAPTRALAVHVQNLLLGRGS